MFASDDEFEKQRRRLIDSLVRHGYLKSKKVIDAMMKVKRHEFVPREIIHRAYEDSPQCIGYGQTISAPHMVAIMVEFLDAEKGNKVLEVGAGCGYHAAVVAHVVGDNGHVYTIERIRELVRMARKNIEKAGLTHRVTVLEGDGSLGLPEHAPYDRIFVSCAAPSPPPPLSEQLAEGGRMLIPVGRFYQELMLYEKIKGRIKKKNLGGCAFVPLIGQHGF